MSVAYRAGQSLEDYCRACKTDRQHTIIAVDEDGAPVRVLCDYCQSQHNYRGGPRVEIAAATDRRAPLRGTADRRAPTMPQRQEHGQARAASREAFSLVSDRERSAEPIMVPNDSGVDLEMLLRRVIREEAGLSAVTPAEKWRGGDLVLRPGRAGIQEKSWPIETFFHKIVMLRNRLRTLEQQVNASELPEDQKVRLQGYISGCYGSLTSFNVLFADEADQFKGSGGD
jgi:hypothetical protein